MELPHLQKAKSLVGTSLSSLPELTYQRLLEVLERSKELGFLGPGQVEEHISHADRFLEAVSVVSGRGMDLGSGGGVPGLVMALRVPSIEWCLVDANQRRCTFLRWASDELRLNLTIIEGRAEQLARDPKLRHMFNVVTARSFGQPAVTAECATGFLAKEGRLIVSEPPTAEDRWDASGLNALGMSAAAQAFGSNVKVLIQSDLCGDRYPRRVGVPAKRPLW